MHALCNAQERVPPSVLGRSVGECSRAPPDASARSLSRLVAWSLGRLVSWSLGVDAERRDVGVSITCGGAACVLLDRPVFACSKDVVAREHAQLAHRLSGSLIDVPPGDGCVCGFVVGGILHFGLRPSRRSGARLRA